jgi:hypothetical protein
MRKLVILFILLANIGQAQDLNCVVQVRSDNIQASNKEIFDDLQRSISQFINQRKWISDKILQQERINCNIVINITSFNIDQFSAEVNISSSRPVYGTSYNTPIFNHFDQEWHFQYAQFQTLDYQENANINSLTTLLAFYANIIIGLDFDSFYPEGGQQYFNKALQIRNTAQNTPGWNPSDGRGNRNKYYIIDNLTDSRFKPLRSAYYQFHINGMDEFKDSPEDARREIFAALEKIRSIQQDLPNSVMFKVFFNTKRNEIINIFQKADPGMKNRAVELLGLLDPSNVNKYEEIKKS